MRAEVVSRDSSELEPLRRRIEGWRRSRPKRRAVPEDLWQEASAAASRLGVLRVAQELGLHYGRLKQRVASSVARPGAALVPRDVACEQSGFIDLGSLAAMVPENAPQPMVVELVAADGARLTIRGRHPEAQVLAMIHAFRGRS